jgi:uncharacterized YigZ family protein
VNPRRVPSGPGTGELRERASRFLAFASRIESPENAAQTLEAIRREYHDATHVAFAWKLGMGDAARSRSSDAGEPSGTAGKPILAAIESAAVTDVLVAVVRYFGGTRLGTGGLARAYREAAARALESSCPSEVPDMLEIEIHCAHESAGEVRRLLALPGVSLLDEQFGEDCRMRLGVLRSDVARLTAALDRARLAYRVEDTK